MVFEAKPLPLSNKMSLTRSCVADAGTSGQQTVAMDVHQRPVRPVALDPMSGHLLALRKTSPRSKPTKPTFSMKNIGAEAPEMQSTRRPAT